MGTTKKFWIRADARLVARIDRIAKREKRTRTTMIEVLLQRIVALQESEDAKLSKGVLGGTGL